SGGRRLPLFQRNSFGGSFGGPIKKDKTFFYGVYEALRQNLGVTILDNVLPAACHQLVNPGTSNTTLANPAGCAPALTSSTVVPQVMQPFLDLYPVPNLPANQFTFPSSSRQREDYGQIRVDQNFSAADTLFGRYTRDRHALKLGMLLNRYHLFTQTTAKLLTGTVTFTDVPSFMQGIYDNYAAGTPNALQRRYWSYKTWGFYAQDDIRATSRLTLNLGFRYEFQTVPRERYGIESRFLNFTDPTQAWSYGPVMRNPSLKNFSPRVGFAWDVRGNGKTAIRSGFGLYQDLANFGSA